MAEEQKEKECPCNQKPTEAQRGLLNFGIKNFDDLVKNPNSAAIGAARQLAGKNGPRLESLINRFSTPTGGAIGDNFLPPGVSEALPSLKRMQTMIESQAGIVDAFSAECDRLSSVEGLLSTVSSLNLFAEINCALGIEGVDIGLGLSVVNQNGQFAIQGVVSANVDLEKVLNQFDGLGTDIADGIEKLQSGLDDAFAKLDEANSKLNELTNQVQNFQNEVADTIQKYTNLNALSELVNQADIDPCLKLGSTINGSLVSPQFINAVRGANPAGFGTFR